MTQKLSDDLGIGYSDFNDTPNGRHCKAFVKFDDGTGLKVFDDKDERDRLHGLQRLLADADLAPGCGDCVDITMPDGSVKYAYTTVLAGVPFDGYSGKVKRSGLAKEMGLDSDRVTADINDLVYRAECAGFYWDDACVFNYGYIDGRAVIIDPDVKLIAAAA